MKFGAVIPGDCLRRRDSVHSHESEALRQACVVVRDDMDGLDFSDLLKDVAEIVFRCLKGQVADK